MPAAGSDDPAARTGWHRGGDTMCGREAEKGGEREEVDWDSLLPGEYWP